MPINVNKVKVKLASHIDEEVLGGIIQGEIDKAWDNIIEQASQYIASCTEVLGLRKG